MNIADEQALVSEEYQELVLEKFNAESSNQTTMKNTGKTGLLHKIPPASITHKLLTFSRSFQEFKELIFSGTASHTCTSRRGVFPVGHIFSTQNNQFSIDGRGVGGWVHNAQTWMFLQYRVVEN